MLSQIPPTTAYILPQAIADLQRIPKLHRTNADYNISLQINTDHRIPPQTATYYCRLLKTTNNYGKLPQTTTDYHILLHSTADNRRLPQITADYCRPPATIESDRQRTIVDYCILPQTTRYLSRLHRLPQPITYYYRLPLTFKHY